MDDREKRLAQNEALFREVNEKVKAVATRHGDDDHVYEFYCECSNADCTLQVPATLSEYEAVRALPARFIIFPGHALPDVDKVVERRETSWTVEKMGDAASYVSRLDPRRR